MAERIRTVEYDPQAGGWIARNPYTGNEILEEGFRWNCRESARTAVWEARHLSPEAKAARGVPPSDGGQQ